MISCFSLLYDDCEYFEAKEAKVFRVRADTLRLAFPETARRAEGFVSLN